MTSSDQPDDNEESVVETINERRPTVAPADLMLMMLPALLAVGLVVGMLSSVSLSAAVGTATLPALALLGYALFYDPPSGYSN
jgi:hypothetical protein